MIAAARSALQRHPTRAVRLFGPWGTPSVWQWQLEPHGYYAYWHYARCISLVRHTSGTADDAYIHFCLQLYPSDSIESPYPAWVIQTASQQSASLLGSGTHYRLLQHIDSLSAQYPVLLTLLQAHRNKLLLDALEHTDLWHPASTALAEWQLLVPYYPPQIPPQRLRQRSEQLADPSAGQLRTHLYNGGD
jgi:hypothetical protein